MSVDELLERAPPATVKGPSELLAEARQRLGLSQKEVADKLYLTISFIKYIDAGEFTSIPKPAFIKGYLRTYARVVELSGDEIVALYEAELQVKEPTLEIRDVTEENVGTASITGPVLLTSLIGLGGFALVVAVIWWMVSDPEEETPLSVDQPAMQDFPEVDFNFVLPPQEGAALQSEQVSQEQAVAGQTALESQLEIAETLRTIDAVEPSLAETVAENREVSVILVAEEPTQKAATEPSISEPSISEPSISEPSISGQDRPRVVGDSVKFERTTDGTRSFFTVDASGFDQLELTFRDECWVEIADNEFGLIYNDLNQANDVLTIYGTAPFKVLLGKATGVEMIYNGRPFELERFISRDRTAKLTVPN
jgi:cytoskeleton protein RodZ